MQNEILQNIFKTQDIRAPIDNRKEYDSKTGFQTGMFVKLIDNHAGNLAFFQPQCDSHPFAV